MNRLFGFILCALFAIVSVISCEKTPMLELTGSSSISIGKEGGSQTITFTANRDWSVSSSETWCRVSPASGTASDGPVSVTVACDPNTTYDARTCTVTVRADELSQTITIKQDTGIGLIVSRPDYNLSNAAQTIEVEVKANVDYTVTPAVSWIKYVETKGLKTSTVVLSIEANETYGSREGTVTIKQNDGTLQETLTIKQGQTDGIFITTPEYDLSNSSHSLSVEVQANVEYTVTPKVDWIQYVQTKALESSVITLSISANEAYDAREGTVEVKQVNGDLAGTITIRQAENYGLFVSNESATISNAEQDVEVTVQYNVDFDLVIPDEGKEMLKVIRYEGDGVDTKALSSRKYIFSIHENTTYDERSVSITFKQRDGSLSGTFKITQAQQDAVLVDKTEYDFNWEDHDLDIPVKANVDVEVSFPEEYYWIEKRQDPETKALTENVIKLHVSHNPTFDARVGEVIILQVGGNLKQTVKVNQSARTWLDADGVVAKAVGGDYKMRVRYNIPYFIDTETLPEWAHYISTTAIDKNIDEITFKIDNHTGYSDRVKVIKIKAEDGSEEIERELRQTKAVFVQAEVNEITVSYESQKIDLDIYSNVDITLRSSANWINISSGNKQVEGDITRHYYALTINENSGDTRNSVLYVNWQEDGQDKSMAIKITQTIKAPTSNQLFYRSTTGTTIAFENLSGIISNTYDGNNGVLVFENDITEIAKYAFYNITELESIHMPNSVISIGDYAFYGCSNLKNVVMPNSVISIGDYAFSGCSNLRNVVMSDNIISIGGYSFYDCRTLVSISIPAGVTEIGAYSFCSCWELTDVKLPEGIALIGDSAFLGTFKLKSITLPSSLEIINNGAFAGSGLESITIPNSVKTLGSSIFADCTSLNHVELPDGLTTIPSFCFSRCKALSEISIPSNVTIIGRDAFSECTGIKSITIPAKVEQIWSYAFYGCSGLQKITVQPITPPVPKVSGISAVGMFWSTNNCPIYIPSQSEEMYKTTYPWNDYANRFITY